MGNYQNPYQKQIDLKLKKIEDSINQSQKYIDELDLNQQQKDEILNSTAINLLRLLNEEQKYTSFQVLITFYEQLLKKGRSLNIITDLMIEQAVSEAKYCDSLRKQKDFSIQNQGILFGLPMSIKENFQVENTDSCAGMASEVNKPYQKNGLFAEAIKRQGAIFFVKTNIPQGMLLPESNNRIYGTCKNPFDNERSAGGSSGGEAAILAIRASPLGLGSDIGGSLRIPSLFCGICSLKPTSVRLTIQGAILPGVSFNGQVNIAGVGGPMASNVDDLTLIMKAQTTDFVYKNDPYLFHLPFDDFTYNYQKTLKIGYFKGSEYFPLSQANQRAIQISVDALKKQGHQLVEFKIPQFQEMSLFYLKFMSLLGIFRIENGLKKEKIVQQYKTIFLISKMPQFIKNIIKLIYRFLGQKRTLAILDSTVKSKDYMTYYKLSEQQQKYKHEFYQLWKESKIDALISPGLALPAFKHGQSIVLTSSVCYTYFFNLIDYPTGNIPITRVQQNEQVYHDPNNQDRISRMAEKCMENSQGLPIGVQITTLPCKEELCLNVMKQLEQQVQYQ